MVVWVNPSGWCDENCEGKSSFFGTNRNDEFIMRCIFHSWLVVWLPFFYFPINIGLLIIPIDELIFFRGVAKNHQPDSYVGKNQRLFGRKTMISAVVVLSTSFSRSSCFVGEISHGEFFLGHQPIHIVTEIVLDFMLRVVPHCSLSQWNVYNISMVYDGLCMFTDAHGYLWEIWRREGHPWTWPCNMGTLFYAEDGPLMPARWPFW